MQTHWTFSGCDATDETRVARYWDERLLELEGKLNALAEEPSELHVAVHHDDSRPSWEVQVALHLPGATLAAESAGDQLTGVLDAVVCELARHIDEHIDEHAERPSTTAGPLRWTGLEVVEGLMRRHHAQGRSQAFFALLQPIMRQLAGYMQHARQALESEDGLPREEVAAEDVEDVLDEALARAWDQFGQYAERSLSQDRPLDQWLREIVEGVLRQSHRPLAQRSLDEDVAEPADDADDPLRDSWTEAGGYPPTVELAELIAGHPGVDAWDRLSAEGENSSLLESLGKLPRDQRQALVLSLTEGFSVAQIADFQGRSTSEVEEDIRLAERTLRSEADATAFDKLEAQLIAARRRPRHRR